MEVVNTEIKISLFHSKEFLRVALLHIAGLVTCYGNRLLNKMQGWDLKKKNHI